MSSLLTIDRRDEVLVVDLGHDDNLLSSERLEELLDLLDSVAVGGRGRALVTTASGRCYSTGLDVRALSESNRAVATLRLLEKVYARLLTLPVPTIAAIPGHAFAGGAMLALAHDVRIMRSGRGFWCLPEVDLGMPLTEGMTALVATRAPTVTAHEAIVTARRYTAEDALAAGLVDRVTEPEALLKTAVEIGEARQHAAGAALGLMKTQLHAHAVDLLERGPASLPAELLGAWPLEDK